MNLQEIDTTIEQLRGGQATFDTCGKLSTLIIVSEYLHNATQSAQNAPDSILNEYSDILPSYNKYVEIKRKYQLKQASYDDMVLSFNLLCTEVQEFIQALYSGTTSDQERELLKNSINIR